MSPDEIHLHAGHRALRILVLHAWMNGNLGDVLQLSVLLNGLRALQPSKLDMLGFPRRPPERCQECLSLVDRYLPDPFARLGMLLPRAIHELLEAPISKSQRGKLLAGYDVIVSAPGAFLAQHDVRLNVALLDFSLARRLGKTCILSCHSIDPLPQSVLRRLSRINLCVAREPATFDYVREHEINCIPGADYAFLYPYQDLLQNPALELAHPPYRLLFLRANNLAFDALEQLDGRILYRGEPVLDAGGPTIRLATSDIRKDNTALEYLSSKLGIAFTECPTVVEMVKLIAGATKIVSDRYHPLIVAACLGKQTRIIPSKEVHKMSGLARFLDEFSLEDIQRRARHGLRAVLTAVGNTSS